MRLRLVLVAWLLAGPALGADDEHGTLNPDEMSMARVLDNVRRGHTDMTTCAAGYLITKSGRHARAREVFEACAAAGYTGAMTWMSQMEDNGLGGDEDPARAAAWDRLAAERGDPVGKFNYGLDLMRGRGVGRDEELGKKYIDAAAEDGLGVAKQLQMHGYDLETVTPDADSWKYDPRVY